MTPERERSLRQAAELYVNMSTREVRELFVLVDSLRAELAAAKVEREAVAVNAIHECADLQKALENTRAALKTVAIDMGIHVESLKSDLDVTRAELAKVTAETEAVKDVLVASNDDYTAEGEMDSVEAVVARVVKQRNELRIEVAQVTAERDRIKAESPTRGHSFVASVVRANSVTCVHCGFSCPAYGDLAPVPLCGGTQGVPDRLCDWSAR